MKKIRCLAAALCLLIFSSVQAAKPKTPIKKAAIKAIETKKAPENKGPLAPLAKQIERSLKNSASKSVAALEFAYLDGHASSGTSIVQKELTSPLAALSVPTFSKSIIDVSILQMRQEIGPITKMETARAIAKQLNADAFVMGDLKDLKGKNIVEVHAIIYETTSGKAIGGGTQTLAKTWKDPVSACGKMAYISLSKPQKKGEISPENIQFVFAEFWPQRTVLGTIHWNFCKPGKNTPTLNDALPELKKRAWEEGGRALIIDKNDIDDDNRDVLKIEARVVIF